MIKSLKELIAVDAGRGILANDTHYVRIADAEPMHHMFVSLMDGMVTDAENIPLPAIDHEDCPSGKYHMADNQGCCWNCGYYMCL